MTTPANMPVPPQDLDAEQAAIGAALFNDDAFAAARAIIGDGASAFYDRRHRLIWSAACRVVDAGSPLDYLAVKVALADELDEAGGMTYLCELPQCVPSAANVEWYAKRAVELGRRRAIVKLCEAGREAAFSPVANSAELLHRLIGDAERLQDSAVVDRQTAAHAIIDAAADELLAGGPGFVGTGLSTLDDIGGLALGELTIIAARPSVGKTSLALTIAANAVRSRAARVVLYSVEMRQRQIALSIMARFGQASAYDLRRGKGDIASARDRAKAALPVGVFDVVDHLSVDREIAADALRRHRHGTDVAIIDYLQLCTPADGGDTRNLEVANMIGTFKRVAQRTGMAAVVCSQLNRDPARIGRRPALSDLRDSGAIEQDADSVWLLHEDERFPSWRCLIVAKSRQGPRGAVWLRWFGESMTFEDANRHEWPRE